MRTNQNAPGNLGFCGNKTHQEIGQDFTRAYRGQGSPPYTEWDLEQIHRRWTRIGKQVAAGAKITGRM
jgi:hypothetical protein